LIEIAPQASNQGFRAVFSSILLRVVVVSDEIEIIEVYIAVGSLAEPAEELRVLRIVALTLDGESSPANRLKLDFHRSGLESDT